MFTVEIDSELKLALIEPSFAKKYFDIVSKEEAYLSQWLAWPPHAKSEDFFLRFVRKSLLDYAEGKGMVCAMIYQGELVGNVSFNTINHQLKMAEIGYWLSESYQGKGIITRAVSKLIEIAFTDLQLEKIQIAAGENNLPSRKVCERLGMTLEGIISNRENLNGRIINHAIYGLSKQPVS
ncbi:N-acetyltransferase [Aliivibrio finisterrensis]|uniref:N-acetyltransferase n=1 Tax=Aliivibrio finisterrensis TaxID=511998 RepID=A0A4Q5KJG2_9GAMM|nr:MULTISPECIES: GNAT family protein [Aliivibrio]MDD9173883.1 GNAT family protein [Aliivibrio sp. S3TY1]MDD9190960.1 GNAT family protein [Aliivibrio sp. S2TY2]RYU46376.1 N-acetyltransferase [Aliivibrio finisterrensis]RYU68714.1 N-acetyltransferase [Aliivibrio finisterrensis]RYU72752.1 N-acetyltransferase [Aliivibrio finisterrensis]